MRLLLLLVTLVAIPRSECQNVKRLNQAFFNFPTAYYFKLKKLNVLPDINTLKDSPDHLRVFANNGHIKAQVLLADTYRDNKKQYYDTLFKASLAGSLLAKETLEEFLVDEQKWRVLLQLPWETNVKNQLAAEMALKIPLSKSLDLNALWTQTGEVCQQKVLTIVNDLAGYKHLPRLIKSFNEQFSLPICFSQPIYLDAKQLACLNNANEPIACTINDKLFIEQFEYHKLAIFVQSGVANAHGKRLSMRYSQSAHVLLHELMHLYGFIDEYPLKTPLAKRICNVKTTSRIAKNIVVTRFGLNEKPTINYKGETWYATNTCNNVGLQAYKPVNQTTHLELLDLAMPERYREWLINAL